MSGQPSLISPLLDPNRYTPPSPTTANQSTTSQGLVNFGAGGGGGGSTSSGGGSTPYTSTLGGTSTPSAGVVNAITNPIDAQTLAQINTGTANAQKYINQGYTNAFDIINQSLAQSNTALQPYMGAGNAALGQYSALMGLGGLQAQQQALAAITASPAYQFQLQQGIAAQNANAAYGGKTEGTTLGQNLQQYGQGLASSFYNQHLQNLQPLLTGGLQTSTAASGNVVDLGKSASLLGAQQGSDLADTELAKTNAMISASAPAQQSLQNFLNNTPYGSNVNVGNNSLVRNALSGLFKF